MSDHQMKKRQIYQTLVYGRTYQTKVLQDWTRNILHGPEIGKYMINGDYQKYMIQPWVQL